jgi:probable HAF family extracellular repeat protein
VVHATLWSGGHVTDLGALGPDECSVAFGLNFRKQVVGLSGSCDFNDPSLRAFVWEPGGPMLDLNTLVSPELGIQLRNVATINDRGEMAVVAFFPDGSHRPVLLIPCDGRADDCKDIVTLNSASTVRSGASSSVLHQNRLNSTSSLPMDIQTVIAARQRGKMRHAPAK